jgi:hypothetical protein
MRCTHRSADLPALQEAAHLSCTWRRALSESCGIRALGQAAGSEPSDRCIRLHDGSRAHAPLPCSASPCDSRRGRRPSRARRGAGGRPRGFVRRVWLDAGSTVGRRDLRAADGSGSRSPSPGSRPPGARGRRSCNCAVFEAGGTTSEALSTDALASGLPPHIVQVLLGHKSITTTQGYAAIYPQDVIRHHRTWIGQRRRRSVLAQSRRG